MSATAFFHILNPNSKKRSSVKRFFKTISPDYHQWVERSSHPTHLETIIDWAIQEGHRNIVIWGGDGTLSRSLQRIYELDALKIISVGLVPAGTCNDFARRLQMPTWKKMAQQLVQNQVSIRKFDLGILSAANKNRIFVNNAGFGRSKEVMQGQASGPLKDIERFSEKRLQIEWQNNEAQQYQTVRAFLGIICNGPFFSGGMHFAKDISPDDGVLNGFIVPPQDKWKLLLRFVKARLGGTLMSENTMRLDAESILIESAQDLYPQADGEFVLKTGRPKVGVLNSPPGIQSIHANLISGPRSFRNVSMRNLIIDVIADHFSNIVGQWDPR